ncbi:DUF4209 domain-containing protein [Rathayibacter tanaceti]|uniref:DUF4209 domain-containing protein n=1 Tax=Rathayibacter tanaceti TaxID=1671680 RepID=UPI0022A9E774|nr:DUF4209 domain-containing protein [Rathayibacter tanaceti]
MFREAPYPAGRRDGDTVGGKVQDQREHHCGPTSREARSEVDRVFGDDLAFLIRALFYSPVGPNISNDFAHGLFTSSPEVSRLIAMRGVVGVLIRRFRAGCGRGS